MRELDGEPEEVWRCQATDALKATEPLKTSNLPQYWRELRSGNFALPHFLFSLVRGFFFEVAGRLHLMKGAPAVGPEPTEAGRAARPTAWGSVQVRGKQEIESTLDERGPSPRLSFDREMLPYCGGTYRVQDRVKRLIDDRTGRMIEIPSDCLILQGVVCSGERSHGRWFCPREIYPYWREAWLRPVGNSPETAESEPRLRRFNTDQRPGVETSVSVLRTDADRRRHVRLDLARAQRPPVHAHLVDPAGEVLPIERITADRQRSGRGGDERHAPARDLDAVHVEAECDAFNRSPRDATRRSAATPRCRRSDWRNVPPVAGLPELEELFEVDVVGPPCRSRLARPPTVGSTHASSVIAVVRSSEAESATVIRAFVPLNESAFPNLPVVTLALPTAPTFPFPDASATLVPMPSLNE